MKKDTKLVGPVLDNTSLGQAAAKAILDENPGTVITHRGPYLQVETPLRSTLSLKKLQKYLGKKIDFPRDLELSMSSFKGVLEISDESMVWSCDEE